MAEIAEAIFWISFFVVFYTYIGYPLLLLLLASFRREQKTENGTPVEVTLVVAAYNEERIIDKKILNTDQLNYPPSLLKVIFITDGSTDNTTEIIQQHSRYLLLHEGTRKGKVAAMNRAMKFVTSEIVIFSDANGLLNSECINMLVRHFQHSRVGGVSGEKKIVPIYGSAVGEGEGLYWKYESLIKKLDSRLHTVVGAAGELFAIRKSLYTPLPENIIIEDFVQSMLLCRKGYTVKYEPGAFSQESASVSIADEMERKVRISAGAFQALVHLRSLLNPFRFPIVFFQLVSHRVLRWTLTPVALVLLLSGAIWIYAITGNLFYGLAAGFQLLFYSGAFAGWYYAQSNRKHPLFYFPFYFLFMNFCVFAGFFRYITGKQKVNWTKAERK